MTDKLYKEHPLDHDGEGSTLDRELEVLKKQAEELKDNHDTEESDRQLSHIEAGKQHEKYKDIAEVQKDLESFDTRRRIDELKHQIPSKTEIHTQHAYESMTEQEIEAAADV